MATIDDFSFQSGDFFAHWVHKEHERIVVPMSFLKEHDNAIVVEHINSFGYDVGEISAETIDTMRSKVIPTEIANVIYAPPPQAEEPQVETAPEE